MPQRLSRRHFVTASVAALAAPALVRSARADEPLRLRLSLDTAPSHLRNVSLKDYLGKVEAASDGKIKTEVFESGQLYPDLEVGKALIQGQVEMAAPGSWTITGIVSGRRLLPAAGALRPPIDLIHRVIDGKPGQLLNGQIQQKLRSHVLGPWLDLGFQNWYSLQQADRLARRPQGHEDPQLRRRRPGLARPLPRRDPQHHGMAERAAGAVAGHLRRPRQFERKPGQRASCGMPASNTRWRTTSSSPNTFRW